MLKKSLLPIITLFILSLFALWRGADVPTHAAPTENVIVVTTLNDSIFPDDACSLREAIDNVNNYSRQEFAVDGDNECPAGSPTQPNIIVLQSGATYQLSNMGAGDLEGDLDVRNDVRFETSGGGPATIEMILEGERVMEIHGATVEIDNVVLKGGNHPDWGGGIYNNEGMLSLYGSYLQGNSANAGGGLYNNNGTVVLNDTAVTGNGGTLGGGGLLNSNGTMTVINSSMEFNASSGGSGGAIANSGGTLVITGTTVLELNTAAFDGGGVYNNAGTVEVHNSALIDNTASQHGGGLANDAGQITIQNSSLTRNQGLGGDGGGVYSRDGGHIFIAQSDIRDNESDGDGGGIAAFSNDALHITHTRIENNKTTNLGDGGGISIFNGTTFIEHSIIRENETLGHGGGINNYVTIDMTAHLTLTHTLIERNKALGFFSTGGGIENWRGGFSVEYSVIKDNEATYHGGGVFSRTAGAPIYIKNSIVENNKVLDDYAGGLYFGSAGKAGIATGIVVMNSTIMGNTAPRGGGMEISSGHATCSDSPHLRIINSTISGNSAAATRGGGILVDSGSVEILHTTIHGNDAVDAGGGVYSENDYRTCVRVGHSIIAGNEGVVIDDVAAGNTTQRFVSLGHNVIGTAGTNVDFNLDFNLPSDQTNVNNAGLAPLTDNGGETPTHALLPTSPAIGAGDPAVCAAASGANGVDQRGFLRDSVTCDSGAYESGLTLAVALDGDGEGDVTSDPSGIDCQKVNCVFRFPHNTAVELTAIPAADQFFVHWTDAVNSSNPTIVVTMNATKSVTAVFSDTEPLHTLYLPIILR
jgi:CSLREA domain-containing protein